MRILFKNSKTFWLYSGYKYECLDDKRKEIVSLCDVFVDGQFEKDKADMKYPYAGSTNQRVIDVQKSLESGEVVLWQKK